MSRIIAIGDIHGCATALDRLLDEIQPTSADTLIGMGDYVDRGMETSRVLEILIDLVASCRFIPLIGNHEIMMFKALQNERQLEYWFQYGGSSTVASYGGRVQNIPQHHLAFLSHCVRFYETEEFFFVHANYDPDVDLTQQPDDLLFWQHVTAYPPPLHYSGKTAIVGHTPQIDGHVCNLGHIRVIDTFCYGDQWLTAHDVDSGEIWQANNQGDFRMAELGEIQDVYERDSYNDDIGDYP